MLHAIKPNLYEIRLGSVNAHLIQSGNELILIDTGSAGDETKIQEALAQINRSIKELTAIVVTHCHADHAGSLAALQRETEAPTFMHPIDADRVEAGDVMRPMKASPGILNRILFRLFIAPAPKTIEKGVIDHRVNDREVLDLAGGLRVVHTPGHSAGQIGLYWEKGSTLFAADAVMNQPNLKYMLGYEDLETGKRSATRLTKYDFETACFGHGRPIVRDASQRFRRAFASSPSSLSASNFLTN